MGTGRGKKSGLAGGHARQRPFKAHGRRRGGRSARENFFPLSRHTQNEATHALRRNHHRRRPRRDHGGERTGGRRQKVAIIEDKHWGGTCLNCGCIPTKDARPATAPSGLLKAQERLRTMKGSIDIDYKALQTRVGRFLKGSSQTLAKASRRRDHLYEGRGVCAGKGQAIVRSESGEEMLTTDNIILSAVRRARPSPASLPTATPCSTAPASSTFRSPGKPHHRGRWGHRRLSWRLLRHDGPKITIVEAAPHIAPTEDADIAKEMDRVQSKAAGPASRASWRSRSSRRTGRPS